MGKYTIVRISEGQVIRAVLYLVPHSLTNYISPICPHHLFARRCFKKCGTHCINFNSFWKPPPDVGVTVAMMSSVSMGFDLGMGCGGGGRCNDRSSVLHVHSVLWNQMSLNLLFSLWKHQIESHRHAGHNVKLSSSVVSVGNCAEIDQNGWTVLSSLTTVKEITVHPA